MASPYGPIRRWARAAALLGLIFTSAAAQARPLKLLVFGDSLSAGYGLAPADAFQAQLGAALKADGFDVTILDGGVSGDTTAGGRSRLEWSLADAPDAVLIELGGNDGLRGLDPAQMEANLAGILDTLAQKRIPALLSGIVSPPNLGAEYGRAFRAVFDRLGKRPGLIYDANFLAGVAGDPALNQPDHIHANPAGVKVIVARIKPAVEALLREAKAP